MNSKSYDIIVVGGGHAGCEAALAAARLGEKTALFTLYLDNIGMMSCNPSIGAPGKSNLVMEMNILGGEMGTHIDKYNLQLKILNESKGSAARITRGQADKYLYRKKMKTLLENTKNLSLIQQCVDEIIVEEIKEEEIKEEEIKKEEIKKEEIKEKEIKEKIKKEANNSKKKIIGIITNLGIKYYAKSIILATGTFLKGKIVIGDVSYSAGRQGEISAEKLSDSLRENGIDIKRYQTATPPRIDRRTIDFSKVKELHGEKHPQYFSIFTEPKEENPFPTWLTYTTEKTIGIVREMLKFSPIMSGMIQSHGPRHCPSIDRKVMNFPEKTNHQIFLEMESEDSEEIYVNGLTTAMPPFVQEAILHTISGLENASIMRYGYAVEYDYAPASQLFPTLESKKIEGLFCAGQINGTSGYEEAASQGFMAGVNAAKKNQNKPPIIIDRSEGYIGVLIDDIIHKNTPEPYRVLPSRAEYRLTLRFNNAFMRLYKKSREIGILSESKRDYMENAVQIVENEIENLKNIKIPLAIIKEILADVKSKQEVTKGLTAYELLKIKEVTYDSLKNIIDIKNYPYFVKNEIETIIKYDIFIERENKQIEKFKQLEEIEIPKDLDYNKIKGLSNIAKSSLMEIRPLSVGEASRISGITGNDLAFLIGNIK
ncbi:MAG: tRNA uridine-5-carboxymethylaminomethyl(34) synthesis enzyme MnmG [Fusobacteriaceae bacterium]|jgi:tRNA uridine 5-carboxymethylaminomethyl modification enzyme|nr:tRNA uridine-5-carboxymethylaminomethyl(34) synthesis enzyme MnmG [Fusobacteriaceae bacterium]